MAEKVVGVLEFDTSKGKLSVREFTQSTKQQLGELEKQSGTTAGKFSSDMKTAFLAVGAAVVAFSAAAISAFQDVESAMKKIRVGTGATGDKLKSLRKDFDAVFGTVPEDAQTVGKVIADLNTRIGLSGPPLQDLTKKFLDFSRIIEEDINQMLPAATRMFGDWNISADKTSGTLDKVFRASQNTGASVNYLMEQVVNFGAPLRNLGFGFEESIALIGKWEKEGVNFQTVMSGMRMAVSYFGKEGINAKEGLADLVNTIQNTDEETGKLAAKTIVGQRAFNDFYDAVKGGKFELEELTGLINDKYGDSIDQAAKDSETSAERMETAWRKLQEQLARVGEAMSPLLDGFAWLIGSAAEIIQFFVDSAEKYGMTTEALEEYYTTMAEKNDEVVKKVMQGTEQVTQKEIEESQKRVKVAIEEKNAKLQILIEEQERYRRIASTNKVGSSLVDVGSTANIEVVRYSEKIRQLRADVEANNKVLGKFDEALNNIATTGKSTGDVIEDANKKLEEHKKNNEVAASSGKEVESYFDNLNSRVKDFTATYKELNGTGFSDATIVKNLGSEIDNIAEAYKSWGMTLPPIIERLKEIKAGLEAYENNIKVLDQYMTNLRDNQEATFEDTSENWKEWTSDIDDTVEAFEDFNDGLDEVPPKVRGMGSAFNETFRTVILNTGDLSKALSTAFGESFSVGLKNYLTEEMGKDWWETTMGTWAAAALPVVGQLASNIGSWLINGITSWFDGPTNEELFEQYGTMAGNTYGEAWSDAVSKKMWEMAEKLPKAKSGKYDMIAAMFHPETVAESLKGLDSFGTDIQNKFADIFEDNVKPVLMNILGMTEQEAAKAMSPLFQTAIEKAIEYGEALTPEMQRMLDWAKNMGVEIEISNDTFIKGFSELVGKEEISIDKLRNMIELAEQLGKDVNEVLVKGMEDFFKESSWSVEKLEQIATAAKQAGYDVSNVFKKAIEDANEEIARLKEELEGFGSSYLDWFDKKLSLQQQARDLRERFESTQADKYYKEWEKNNKKKLEGMSEEERAAAESNAQQDAKAKANERFLDIQQKVNNLNLDGKHDLKDIRDMVKDLPEHEKQLAIELAKNKLAREEHKAHLKELREEQKRIKEEIKKQKEKVENLTAAEQRTLQATTLIKQETTAWRAEMDKIYSNWKWMYEHPVNFQGGGSGSGRSSGGIVSYGSYTVGENGPEYVMSNSALNTFGHNFFDSLNNGRMPIVSSGGGPTEVRITLDVKKEPGSIKIVPRIGPDQVGAAINFEVIDLIANELEARGKVVTK